MKSYGESFWYLFYIDVQKTCNSYFQVTLKNCNWKVGDDFSKPTGRCQIEGEEILVNYFSSRWERAISLPVSAHCLLRSLLYSFWKITPSYVKTNWSIVTAVYANVCISA